MATKSAVLWGLHDKFFGTRPGDRCGLELVTECEFSLYTAYRAWKGNVTEVLLLSEREDLWKPPPPAPKPYQHHLISERPGDIPLIANAEWLVAAVMDSCYALTERLTSTTAALCRRSKNLVWADIQVVPQTGGNVEGNLLDRFLSKSEQQSNDLFRGFLKTLTNWRGARTHQCHLYVHVEREPPAVVYQDVVLYGTGTPTLRFTSVDLEQRMHVLGLYLSWWVGLTHAYLEHNKPKGPYYKRPRSASPDST